MKKLYEDDSRKIFWGHKTMPANAVLPFWRKEWMHQKILTFVVPSLGGCNLRCPFCIINQKNEDLSSPNLNPNDYRKFIEEVDEHERISLISIQGHEPLLASSFPYTKTILQTGRSLGVSTGLVTNGTYLAVVAGELAKLEPDTLVISVDSASAHRHDKLRGVKGAWAHTIENIRRSIDKFSDNTTISVNSILMPGKREWLDNLPALLRSIGINQWIVTVVMRANQQTQDGSGNGGADVLADLLALQQTAREHGVKLAIDDEFARLTNLCDKDSLLDRNGLLIRRLNDPSNIFRLLPSGQCSVGTQILDKVAQDTPRWIPGQINAGDFLHRLVERRPPSYAKEGGGTLN